jgi:effector-binding domain-containing protein
MVDEIECEPQLVAGVRAEVTADELGEFFGRAMGEVMRLLPRELIAGPVVAVYHRDERTRFDVTIGMPVSAAPDFPGLDVVELPGGAVLRATHFGEYPRLGEAYAALRAELAERGAPFTFEWERYVAGPGDVADPASYVTEVLTPLTA